MASNELPTFPDTDVPAVPYGSLPARDRDAELIGSLAPAPDDALGRRRAAATAAAALRTAAEGRS